MALTLQVSGWFRTTETEQKVVTAKATAAAPPTCSWLYPSRHLTRPGSGGGSFIRAAAPRESRTRRHCLDAAAGPSSCWCWCCLREMMVGNTVTLPSSHHHTTAAGVPTQPSRAGTAENDNWDKKQFGNQKCISQYMLSSGCQATNRVLNRVPQF